MKINCSTEIDQSTVDAVITGRIARGLVPMLVEALAYGRALESGERFTPSSPGMDALLRSIDAIWTHEQADPVAPLGDASPPWLSAYAERRELEVRERLPFDDTPDPQLLADKVPGYLLRQPPIAHGIAPLPPLGGWRNHE